MTSRSADDLVEEGERLLQARSYGQAWLAFARALDRDPRRSAAHYNLGALFVMAGRPGDALPGLITASELAPTDPAVAFALARALVDLGETARAASVLLAAAEAASDSKELRAAAAKLDAPPAALKRLDGVADRDAPPDLEDRLEAVERALAAGDGRSAFAAASALIWAAPASARLWLLLSRSGEGAAGGDYVEMCARRAVALAPDEPAAWIELARRLAVARGRGADAGRVLETALASCGLEPELVAERSRYLRAAGRDADAFALLDRAEAGLGRADATLVRARAELHEAAGAYDRAAAVYDAALEKGAGDERLVIAAAAFHDRQVDPAPMLRVLERARAAGLDFESGELLDLEARALLRAGRLDAARASIEGSLSRGGSAQQLLSRRFTLARIEDKRGDHRAAFEAAMIANRAFERIWEEDGPCDHAIPLARIESFARRLHAERESGRDVVGDRAAGPDNIAFLVGFPRSGTTLLDTVLRSHSQVVVIEERPVLIEALRGVVPGPVGDETNFTEAWLDQVDACEPARLRAAYHDRLTAWAGGRLKADTVYVDKLPLNLNWAQTIQRVFPRAVFILCLRHPLDVAISNLLQNYQPNNAMLNMTRLARIDALYERSFSLWEAFRSWREPVVETVRYEAMIDDLPGAVAPVMRRLGLDWETAQSRYFETAKRRARINTPSADQVRRALYTSSRERWRDYAFAFEGDDAAALRRWATRHGYEV